jgi:hypothetical protein
MDEQLKKYNGKITFDETGEHERVCVECKNNEINISLNICDVYGEKLKICSEIIEKYMAINEMAKKAILERFSTEKTVKYSIECKFEIEKILK